MDFKMTQKMAMITAAVAVAVIALSAVADAVDEKRRPAENATAELIDTSPIPTYELPVVIVTEEPEATPAAYYPEVALDADLQEYIREKCEEAGIKFEMVLALITWEHRGHPDAAAISGTNDYGLMQINRINHQWLAEEYGLTDMLDPRQNIQAGLVILGISARYGGEDADKVLMAYNMGPTGAEQAWDQGITYSTYSRTIIEIMEDIEAGTYSVDNFTQDGNYKRGA